MQMQESTLQDSTFAFKDLIKQSVDEITRSWLEAVREDRSIPSAEGLEEPLLLDAVPLVLDEILRMVQLDDSNVEHEKICSAARHGRERAQEHFDVRELVREYQLLREHIFLHLHEESPLLASFVVGNRAMMCARVGGALDEAMRETINAFVEEHELQLRRLSRIDSLTGLFNHRIFYERLADELNRARRYDSPLSIVLIDLDNFKSVNDTKGHQFGDQLLVKCAERLRVHLRETDILCRYGGDEFGLILTETKRENAEMMMTRLAKDFKELGRKENTSESFGMSFGLSAHPEDSGTLKRLVKVADDRLLESKQRNKVGLALAVTER